MHSNNRNQKNPYPPQGRSSEIPRRRGLLKAKILEAKYEAINWNFLRGGANQRNLRWGEYMYESIFSGTSQSNITG